MGRKKLITIKIIFIISLLSFRSPFSSELIGLSFNQPVQTRHIFSVSRYQEQSKNWGVGYYPDKSIQIFKDAINIKKSKLAEFLTSYQDFNTSIFLSHIIDTTSNLEKFQNIQPFQREIQSKNYLLVHSGKLVDIQKKLSLKRFKPIGETDSEYFFCYMLGLIENENIQQWDETKFLWLQNLLREVNKLGILNCLFSDGTYVFIYRDKKSKERNLYFVKRKAPYKVVNFIGPNKKIDLSQIYPESSLGYILSSKPLTDEQWTKLGNGQLLVLKDGVRNWQGATEINVNEYVASVPLNSPPLYTIAQSNTSIIFGFKTTKELPITIELIDMKGNSIRKINEINYTSGDNLISVSKIENNRKLAKGIYFCKLGYKNVSKLCKLIIVK